MKTVTIKADTSGLLRSSITGQLPTTTAPTTSTSIKDAIFNRIPFLRTPTGGGGEGDSIGGGTTSTAKKTILDEISGFAAPGEIVAMMG